LLLLQLLANLACGWSPRWRCLLRFQTLYVSSTAAAATKPDGDNSKTANIDSIDQQQQQLDERNRILDRFLPNPADGGDGDDHVSSSSSTTATHVLCEPPANSGRPEIAELHPVSKRHSPEIAVRPLDFSS